MLRLERRQLILVLHPGRQRLPDFFDIAREIAKQAPEIVTHILTHEHTVADVPARNWEYPTLTVSFNSTGNFIPLRGRVFRNRKIKKLDQFARFRSCGIATPHTERFEFGKSYDEALFGTFAVLKLLPLELTSTGKSIQLFRTASLSTLKPADLPADHFLRKAPALVQRFIDTGRRPFYYRVLTVLGEPVLWMKVTSPEEQIDLTQSTQDVAGVIVDPRSVASGETHTLQDRISYDVPEDALNFGRHVFQAFPDVPLQACDIMREKDTGELYVIEINAGGNTWDFSSNRVAKGVALLGGRDALVKEFDPWPKAAKALVAAVRNFAS